MNVSAKWVHPKYILFDIFTHTFPIWSLELSYILKETLSSFHIPGGSDLFAN